MKCVRQYYREKSSGKAFDSARDIVHYAGRVFDAEDLCNLVDASLDFYFTANRYGERFETEFPGLLGQSNAMLVNSGSSANFLALTILTPPKLADCHLKPGDEVLTVACGFPTPLNPILQDGLIPVFVDVNLGNSKSIMEYR